LRRGEFARVLFVPHQLFHFSLLGMPNYFLTHGFSVGKKYGAVICNFWRRERQKAQQRRAFKNTFPLHLISRVAVVYKFEADAGIEGVAAPIFMKSALDEFILGSELECADDAAIDFVNSLPQ